MPYVSPADVVTGTVGTSAWGDSVKAATDYLANPPTCRVFHSVAQSIPDAATTTATFNSERWDTDSMHSTATNPTRITINTAGLYLVTFTGMLAGAADYLQVLPILRLSGATDLAYGTRIANVAGAAPILTLTTVYKFTVGQWLELQVYQDNSANAARNLDAAAPIGPEFAATWIGLG